MKFASEQVIRASKLGLNIRELDIEYHRRRGESKLASFSGWVSVTGCSRLPGAICGSSTACW